VNRKNLHCSSENSRIPWGGRFRCPPYLFLSNVITFETTVRGVSRLGLARFARKAQKMAGVRGEVEILIAGNRRLQELNRRFRRKNKPTDVLSFPNSGGGDIAISAAIAGENARRYGHSTTEELKILILHGMLHLAGHDHETDNGRMAMLESRMRGRLKLPASLIERAQPADTPSLPTGTPGRRLR
jgi:probable rRNA maturation factor